MTRVPVHSRKGARSSITLTTRGRQRPDPSCHQRECVGAPSQDGWGHVQSRFLIEPDCPACARLGAGDLFALERRDVLWLPRLPSGAPSPFHPWKQGVRLRHCTDPALTPVKDFPPFSPGASESQFVDALKEQNTANEAGSIRKEGGVAVTEGGPLGGLFL